MAYPTSGDLRQYLLSAGCITSLTDEGVIAGLQLDTCINAARKNFESDAGRTMIAVTQTRKFDPPWGGTMMLNLGSDLASDASFTVTVSGVSKTRDTDFYMGPQNADNDGQPWSFLEFAYPFSPVLLVRKCISITGPWGFASTLPNDVYIAMLAGGASLAMPAIQRAVSQGMIERKEGDTDYKFDDAATKNFDTVYRGGVDQYIRYTSWI